MMLIVPSDAQEALKAVRLNQPRTLSSGEITFLFLNGLISISSQCTFALTRDGEELADTLIANAAAEVEVYS